ncbi:MAG TPA: hypothetical protein VMS12_12045 [Thermoanaerobaculia bacterium]|nr:hypothetical protein [Thermoanaerobaculia bacterium]
MESPAALDSKELLERIRRNEVPREFVAMAARGFLPFPQEDLIAILAVLSEQDDQEIAAEARHSLQEIPRAGLLSFAHQESAAPDALASLLKGFDDQEIVSALLRNRSMPNDAVAVLAGSAEGKIQEIIVTNQRRLIEEPKILEALLDNPQLTGDVKRRALEAREEFFEKRAVRDARLEAERALEVEEALDEEAQKALDEILAQVDESEDVPGADPPPDDIPEEEKPVWVRILNMSVSARVRLAFQCGRPERAILIKDSSKLVSTAVIRSPKITESEVENFASMRNLDSEVLRLIGTNREWMRKYPIMLTLVRNPKAPIGVVLPLINRLNLRDLKNLSQDRNVPETIRLSARKLFVARAAK